MATEPTWEQRHPMYQTPEEWPEEGVPALIDAAQKLMAEVETVTYGPEVGDLLWRAMHEGWRQAAEYANLVSCGMANVLEDNPFVMETDDEQ